MDWRAPTDAEREAIEGAVLALASNQAEIRDLAFRPWASITFVGSRVKMTVRFHGAEAVVAGEQFIAFLPEHEFDIPGQIVADAAVTGVSHEQGKYLGATIEILLLEDQP